MRILALQGSPRSEGNTQTLLEIVLAGAREAGAAAEVVQLAEFRNLVGCEECYTCKDRTEELGPDESPCAVEDDMVAIYAKMASADVLVWATPIFCWTPSWLLKIAMDRTFCLFQFGSERTVRSALAGRRMAAVITSGDDTDSAADLTIEALRRLAAFAQCEWLGVCAAGNLGSHGELRPDDALRAQAREFGHRLATTAAPAP